MTDDTTINLDLITREGVDPVKTGEREFETCGGSIGEEELAFLEACYEEHFVQSFDWMAWTAEHGETLKTREYIDGANLEQLIKLITAHLRMDRFHDGHFLACLQNGTIQAILKRLAHLRTQMD